MISMIHDEPVPLGIRPPLAPDPEGKPEFKLNPGERYGWWVENYREEERRQCATVHEAANNFKPQILLDAGTTVSMISLDLARRLKSKFNSQKRVKVSELGGVLSYITSSAQIKITLGWRVVDSFMFSAGVRLGIREGMVGLPDEESILMYGYINESVDTGMSQSASFEDCICDPENMQMWPSDMDSVVRSKMLYGQEERTDGSPKLLTAHDLGQFVRPGLRRYMERQQIFQENTVSAKARVHRETYEQMFRDAAPPAVMAPRYR
ncbi:hypothetical protein PHMEG_00012474 [Phytophthora megakarya]|uniref:Peptidase A2 domain-containing protein n=1 Tax=Phytophthora megakarya TaxID=4795 RepID=A0A225WAQ9_9STRA|nr:hypothetical protein PHMEG_00012474 [Phytophthora megakarya]